MPGWQCRIPDLRYPCVVSLSVDAGSSAALWRVRLARRRVSSVVVQVNCSEASRVGDGTRREAAVTARRDSWRVSRSTAVEIPMGRGRLGGSWEADGRGERIYGRNMVEVTEMPFPFPLHAVEVPAARWPVPSQQQSAGPWENVSLEMQGPAAAPGSGSAVLAPAAPRRVARRVFFFLLGGVVLRCGGSRRPLKRTGMRDAMVPSPTPPISGCPLAS